MNSADERSIVDPQGALTPRWLFTFEKWYLDGQTADGSFFFLYLAPMVLAGKRSAELVVSLFPAEGGAVRRSFHVPGNELDVSDDRCSALLPAGELVLDRTCSRVTLELEGAAVDLSYHPIDPPWTPPNEGRLVERSGRALRWIVPIPRACLEGTVRVDDREVAFDGFGYSDFVQTDIPPWSLPLRELLWGRVLGPDTLVIFNRVGLAQGRTVAHLPLGLVRLGEGPRWSVSDLGVEFPAWADHEPTGDRYPVEDVMALSGEDQSAELVLHETELHLGEFVADVQRFGSGLERRLYRTVTGDPVEYKLWSRARIDGQPRDAWAAHEWIRWGRGR